LLFVRVASVAALDEEGADGRSQNCQDLGRAAEELTRLICIIEGDPPTEFSPGAHIVVIEKSRDLGGGSEELNCSFK